MPRQPTQEEKIYRQVAAKLIAKLDPRRSAAYVQGQPIIRTRTPPGAWVQMYVWVPKEMMLMEQASGKD